MTDTTKRYLISSGITFLTAFCLYFLTEIDNLSLDSFINGSYVGVLFAAVRAGIKALMELFLRYQNKL